MKKIGLICDLAFDKHMQFRNYYYALLALYEEVTLVKSIDDLPGLDILFVGAYVHGPHWEIVTDYNIHHKPLPYVGGELFVNKCNELNITLVLWSTEMVFGNSSYSHISIPTYNILSKCNSFYHYAYDINDCKKLGCRLHKLAMSKHYKNCINNNIEDKKDEIVFIGKSYTHRKELLRYVADNFPLTVREPTIPDWEHYLQVMSQYRFVLSPLGDANGFVTRFYEILLVQSIPVHQVKKDTLQYYNTEAGFEDCIFFERVEELPEKIENFKLMYSQSEIWLEDYLETLLKADGLL